MSFELLANIVAKGLLTGAVYGLMALGLSVIFGVMRVVNFAHGEMMMLSMFGAFTLYNAFGLDPLYALPLIAFILFLFGYGLQRTVINRFLDVPDYVQFLLLLGIAIVMTNGALAVWGPDARGVQLEYAFESYRLGFLTIDKSRLLAASAALAIALALWLFLTRTVTGKAIRACADNLVGAEVVGLPVKRLYAITFGIGSACVGAAGSLMLLVVAVHPNIATSYTLLAFIIVIVGGLGSMGGALLGGMLIGVSEALAGFLIAPSMKSMFSFGLLILVLVLRPQGLLGRKGV